MKDKFTCRECKREVKEEGMYEHLKKWHKSLSKSLKSKLLKQYNAFKKNRKA